MIVKRQDLMDAVKSLTFKSHLIGDWVDKLRFEVTPGNLRLTITDTSIWLVRNLSVVSAETWSVVTPLSVLRKTLQHIKDDNIDIYAEDNLLVLKDQRDDYLSVPTIVLPKFPEASDRELIDSRELDKSFIEGVRFLIGLQDSDITDSRWYFISALADGWLIGGSPGCTGVVRISEGFGFNLRSETAKIISRIGSTIKVLLKDRQLVFQDEHDFNIYAIAERSQYPYVPADVTVEGEPWSVDRLSFYTAVQTLKGLSGNQSIHGRFSGATLQLTVPTFKAQKTVQVTGNTPDYGWAVNSGSLLNVLKRFKGDRVECLQSKKRIRLADQSNQVAVLTRYAIR